MTGGPLASAQWQVQEVKTDADFRGLSVVGASVAWACGTKGTFGRTTDGGRTWAATAKPRPFRSAVARAEDQWVALGPSGSDASAGDGATRTPPDKERSNAVAFTPAGDGGAVGPKGRIARFATADE